MSLLANEVLFHAVARRGMDGRRRSARRSRLLDALLWALALMFALGSLLAFPARTAAAPRRPRAKAAAPRAKSPARARTQPAPAPALVRWAVSPTAWIGSTDPAENGALQQSRGVVRVSTAGK